MKYLYFLKRIPCINHAGKIASLSFGNVRNDVTCIVILSVAKDLVCNAIFAAVMVRQAHHERLLILPRTA